MNTAPFGGPGPSTTVTAKQLYAESKQKLSDRIQQNINVLGSLCREINRGSKSQEILEESAKNLLQLEGTIETTAQGVEKLSAFVTHLGFQHEAIQNSVQKYGSVQNLCDAICRLNSEPSSP